MLLVFTWIFMRIQWILLRVGSWVDTLQYAQHHQQGLQKESIYTKRRIWQHEPYQNWSHADDACTTWPSRHRACRFAQDPVSSIWTMIEDVPCDGEAIHWRGTIKIATALCLPVGTYMFSKGKRSCDCSPDRLSISWDTSQGMIDKF